jgi:hypothetical protein
MIQVCHSTNVHIARLLANFLHDLGTHVSDFCACHNAAQCRRLVYTPVDVRLEILRPRCGSDSFAQKTAKRGFPVSASRTRLESFVTRDTEVPGTRITPESSSCFLLAIVIFVASPVVFCVLILIVYVLIL